MRTERSTFSTLFIILAFMLTVLPFISIFQDVLTRVVLFFDWYRAFQNIVIPYEMKVVNTMLNLLHIPTLAGHSYIQFVRNGKPEVIYLAWNCIGWQSFIFLFITLMSGLSGRYTLSSKIQAFMVGILGTYLINMFRLTTVMVLYYFTGRGIGLVFHNYFSNLLSIVWLFIFWWIAYSFVLEDKKRKVGGLDSKKGVRERIKDLRSKIQNLITNRSIILTSAKRKVLASLSRIRSLGKRVKELIAKKLRRK